MKGNLALTAFPCIVQQSVPEFMMNQGLKNAQYVPSAATKMTNGKSQDPDADKVIGFGYGDVTIKEISWRCMGPASKAF